MQISTSEWFLKDHVTLKTGNLKVPLLWICDTTFHAVCNTARSEWKHPAKFYIWKCTVYKVIVSQMKESTMNHLRVVFKTNPKPFNVEVNMKH